MGVYSLYFSPTGNSRKAAIAVAEVQANKQKNVIEIDYTRFENRQKNYEFKPDDILVLAMPTYAGRLPNKILPDLQKGIHGNNTPVITIVTFGNRSEDESLRELTLLAKNNGFLPVGAAACVSEHAFSEKLASGRPDENDMEKIRGFAKKCLQKISGREYGIAKMDFETPIGPYYIPKQEDGAPAKFLKAKPLTNEAVCNHCGVCVSSCPMDSIEHEDCTKVTGICIKCNACIHACPVHAKYFDDVAFLSHVRMLEKNYLERKESKFYL